MDWSQKLLVFLNKKLFVSKRLYSPVVDNRISTQQVSFLGKRVLLFIESSLLLRSKNFSNSHDWRNSKTDKCFLPAKIEANSQSAKHSEHSFYLWRNRLSTDSVNHRGVLEHRSCQHTCSVLSVVKPSNVLFQD